jgi:hypothetical protein
MTSSFVLRAGATYTVAGALTAAAAFVASIPFTGVAVTAVTADAAVLVGWPTLLAADAITARLKGGRR